MRKFRYVLIFVIFSAVLVIAEDLPDGREAPAEYSELLSSLDIELIKILNKDEHIFRYDEEHIGPVYIPETEYRNQVEDIHNALNPEVMVEGLYRVPYPEGMESKAAFDKIYELSHNVSSISGAMYYSERKKKYAVLFTKVYAVNNIEDRDRIEDPVLSDNEREQTVFLHMKENALGRGYYRMDYNRNIDLFTLKVTNETDLGFIIPAVAEENMIIFLQIIPCSDAILIYGYCGVVLQNEELVTLMLDPYYAFYRRMTAMETWLYNSLHGTDMLPPLYEPRE